jgi:hypothetical protein
MGADLAFDFLDSVKYLYLRQLFEPRENSLSVTVQEAVTNPAAPVREMHSKLPELRKLAKGASLIESNDACRTFELTWNRYVAYLVTEEMVGSCGSYEDEKFTGKLFRIYSKSHFLDHLARDTGAHWEPIQHFKLTCLNHLVDVAAYAAPEIRLLGPVSSSPNRIQ